MNALRRMVIATLALVMVSAVVFTSSAQQEDEVDVMTAFVLELFNEGETEHVEEFVSPDLFIHFLDSRPDQEGVDGLLQWANGVRAVLPDVNLTIEQRIVEGDLIAVLLTVTGTHTGEAPGIPATGNEVIVQAMWMLRVADGQIVEWWQLEDSLNTYTQLGLIPPIGSDDQE